MKFKILFIISSLFLIFLPYKTAFSLLRNEYGVTHWLTQEDFSGGPSSAMVQTEWDSVVGNHFESSNNIDYSDGNPKLADPSKDGYLISSFFDFGSDPLLQYYRFYDIGIWFVDDPFGGSNYNPNITIQFRTDRGSSWREAEIYPGTTNFHFFHSICTSLGAGYPSCSPDRSTMIISQYFQYKLSWNGSPSTTPNLDRIRQISFSIWLTDDPSSSNNTPEEPSGESESPVDGRQSVTQATPTLEDSSSVKPSPPIIDRIDNKQIGEDRKLKGIVRQGRSIVLAGRSIPNATVKLYIYSEPITVETKSDKDGNWSYILIQELSVGEHRVEAEVIDEKGNTSDRAEIAQFIVKPKITPVQSKEAEKIPFFVFNPLAYGLVSLAVVLVGLLTYLIIKRRKLSLKLINFFVVKWKR